MDVTLEYWGEREEPLDVVLLHHNLSDNLTAESSSRQLYRSSAGAMMSTPGEPDREVPELLNGCVTYR